MATDTTMLDTFLTVVDANASTLTGGKKADVQTSRDAVADAYRAVPAFHRAKASAAALTGLATSGASGAAMTALAEVLTAVQAESATRQTRRRDANVAPAYALAALLKAVDTFHNVTLPTLLSDPDSDADAATVDAYAFSLLTAPDADQTAAVDHLVGKVLDAATPRRGGGIGTRNEAPRASDGTVRSIATMVGAGLLNVGDKLTYTVGDDKWNAVVTADGLRAGKVDYTSPSTAACGVRGLDRGVNGWTAWKTSDGQTIGAIWTAHVS